MRNEVRQNQFPTSLIAVFRVTGASVVTTETSSAGLDSGKYLSYVKKGAGADSNLVTFTFKRPLGRAPILLFQPVTLDCACREDTAPTKTGFTVRTLLHSNLASKADNANFNVFLFGTRDVTEGQY